MHERRREEIRRAEEWKRRKGLSRAVRVVGGVEEEGERAQGGKDEGRRCPRRGDEDGIEMQRELGGRRAGLGEHRFICGEGCSEGAEGNSQA